MPKHYEVTVANIFEAVSPQDAVLQMAEWLLDTAMSAGYRVQAEGEAESIFIDADDIDATRIWAEIDDGHIWPSPDGEGWVDAWNGWYPTEAEARRDAAAGLGRPWVLEMGEGVVTEAEMARRQERDQ